MKRRSNIGLMKWRRTAATDAVRARPPVHAVVQVEVVRRPEPVAGRKIAGERGQRGGAGLGAGSPGRARRASTASLAKRRQRASRSTRCGESGRAAGWPSVVEAAGDLAAQTGQAVALLQVGLGEQQRGQRQRARHGAPAPRAAASASVRAPPPASARLLVQPVDLMPHPVRARQRAAIATSEPPGVAQGERAQPARGSPGIAPSRIRESWPPVSCSTVVRVVAEVAAPEAPAESPAISSTASSQRRRRAVRPSGARRTGAAQRPASSMAMRRGWQRRPARRWCRPRPANRSSPVRRARRGRAPAGQRSERAGTRRDRGHAVARHQ